ncbi:MAG: ribonucleotide reductase N-terminal alpha domain-containing protein, partial [Candidatus Eremiobacterota bacterium]
MTLVANRNGAVKVKELDPIEESESNVLSPLGEKIFLDRYALKDAAKKSLAVGDTVVVLVDSASGQREIGRVASMKNGTLTVELRDGVQVERALEHVDKPLETTVGQMMDRVARGAASVEVPEKQRQWSENFRWLLDGWKFVPGGRILTACGTDQNLTYYNCYVIPSPHDSRDGIFKTLSHMAEIMSRGGGVGINLSSLRPRYSYVRGVNGRSSGSVSWGGLYSFVTGLIEQGGSRRGALMLILNVWHPDALDFINSKRDMGKIVNANISVGITDDFMEAVEKDGDWNLVFPDTGDPRFDKLWNGNLDAWKKLGGRLVVHKTLKAREVWNQIIESAWASAEPGIFFTDRSNKMSNSWYYPEGYLVCTNPCVTGDALISTDAGLERAVDLCQSGHSVRVAADSRLHSESFVSASSVFATGVKPVFRLTTQEGFELRLTADHQVRTQTRGWVPAGELVSGDAILVQDRPGGFGREGNEDLGLVLGWLVGDGPVKEDLAVLSFFGETEGALANPVAAGGK